MKSRDARGYLPLALLALTLLPRIASGQASEEQLPYFDRPVTSSPTGFEEAPIDRFGANSTQYWFDETPDSENPVLSKFRTQYSLGETLTQWGQDFGSDNRNFYTQNNFQLLLGTFAIGAATANTPFDETLRDILQDALVYTPSDEYAEFLHENRYLGDGYIVLPAYAGLAILGKHVFDDPNAYVVGEWSERNVRAMLVGAPVLLLSQSLTGASRPEEAVYGSDWRPFRDVNGVSGHAYMGAIPFLTAARMSRNPWAKAGFYVASALPGLSRITDDRHYPSQVFLGWTIAYVATSAIAGTEDPEAFQFGPMVVGDNLGFGVSFRR